MFNCCESGKWCFTGRTLNTTGKHDFLNDILHRFLLMIIINPHFYSNIWNKDKGKKIIYKWNRYFSLMICIRFKLRKNVKLERKLRFFYMDIVMVQRNILFKHWYTIFYIDLPLKKKLNWHARFILKPLEVSSLHYR